MSNHNSLLHKKIIYFSNRKELPYVLLKFSQTADIVISFFLALRYGSEPYTKVHRRRRVISQPTYIFERLAF